MLRIAATRLWRVVVLVILIAAACAEPDLGPPSSTTLPLVTPTPTPDAEPDPALGPSNITTTTSTTTVPVDTSPTPTPTPVPIPQPGLTDTTITLGVIADVTTGTLNDERGESAWSAVAAWAAAVNDAGGVAGRQVRVQPIDSAVSFHTEALAEACSEVFAIVGSWSLNDGDGLEVLLSPDCSLPDFPADARSPARRRSPVTYQSNPKTVELEQGGAARFLVANFPDETQAAGVPILDLDATRVGGERQIEAYTINGFEIIQRPTVGLEDDLTGLAALLSEAEVDALVWPGDVSRLGQLLAEMDVLQSRPALVDCGSACYDSAWIEEVGELAEGIVVTLPVVPFEEIDTSFELTSYVFWLSRARPVETPDLVGVQAWAAARLFEEAVNRATTDSNGEFDPELLTRRSVLDAAETITEWNANGLHETTNPADGIGSPCFVSMAQVGGVWQRTHPFGRGRFDCESTNLVPLELTADLGLVDAATGFGLGDDSEAD